MPDITTGVLITVIIILTIILVVFSVQVFFILRDFHKSLKNFDKILTNFESVTKKIDETVTSASLVSVGAKFVTSLLSQILGKNEPK